MQCCDQAPAVQARNTTLHALHTYAARICVNTKSWHPVRHLLLFATITTHVPRHAAHLHTASHIRASADFCHIPVHMARSGTHAAHVDAQHSIRANCHLAAIGAGEFHSTGGNASALACLCDIHKKDVDECRAFLVRLEAWVVARCVRVLPHSPSAECKVCCSSGFVSFAHFLPVSRRNASEVAGMRHSAADGRRPHW